MVGIAEMRMGRPGDLLVTHALGSCLGVVAHDPVAGVGGMLHVMLPSSRINEVKAKQAPWMFVDTGVPMLFDACRRAGGKKERIVVKVAGGAGRADEANDSFQIGKRNMVMLRKLLWKNGVLIQGHDVGGRGSRDLQYDVATGTVTVRSAGTERTL